MKCLVTGVAGFIGSHLADLLLSLDHEVLGVDDLSAGTMSNIKERLSNDGRFKFVNLDLSVRKSKLSLATHARFDRTFDGVECVFHLASAVGVERILKSSKDSIESCLGSMSHVLEYADACKLPLLFTSTSEVYGVSEDLPYREDGKCVLGCPTKARWVYATSKLIDEHLALAYHRELGLNVVIARLFNTVGERQSARYGMVLPRFVKQAIAHEPLTIYGDGQQTRCFCHVSDTVQALWMLMNRLLKDVKYGAIESTAFDSHHVSGQIFNVGSTHETSIDALAQIVAAHAEAPPLELRYGCVRGPGDEEMPRRVPDTSKIKRLCAWEPKVALSEIVRRVFEYERARS